MDTLRQDLVYALRRLRQAPVFAFVAIATLALGIGANSAIFSVVNAVLLRPLPFSEPNGLVMVNQIWEGKATVYSPQNFLDMEASAKSFESLAALDSGGITLTGRGTAVRLEGAEVGASFFGVLRVAPILGRGFLPGENDTGRNKVAVLGHRLWRSTGRATSSSASLRPASHIRRTSRSGRRWSTTRNFARRAGARGT